MHDVGARYANDAGDDGGVDDAGDDGGVGGDDGADGENDGGDAGDESDGDGDDGACANDDAYGDYGDDGADGEHATSSFRVAGGLPRPYYIVQSASLLNPPHYRHQNCHPFPQIAICANRVLVVGDAGLRKER